MKALFPPMPTWSASSPTANTRAEDAESFRRAAQVVRTTESCDTLLSRLRLRAMKLREELEETNDKAEELRRIEAILALEDK